MDKITAVLFDLDGTLTDTIADLAFAVNHTLGLLGCEPHSIESCKYMVGNGMYMLISRALPEPMRSDEQIQNALKIFMRCYEEHSLDTTAPYDGICDTVARLRRAGIKTAVITNKAEKSAKYIVERFFPDMFDVVIGARENLPPKPDPTGTRAAMEFLGVEPRRCLFVGDSGVDMQTAVNAGVFGVGALWGFRTRAELIENGAKAIVSAPPELLKFIN